MIPVAAFGGLGGPGTPRVVEVVGPPGSGKSTLVAALEEADEEVRVLRGFRSPARLPGLAAAGLRGLLAARPRRRWGVPPTTQQLRWIARLEAAPRRVRGSVRPGTSALVFDQGPVYTLVRLAAAASDDGGWGPRFGRWLEEQQHRTAGLLDVLVVLDAPPVALCDRVFSRHKPHAFKGLSRGQALRALDADRAAYSAMVTALGGVGGMHVLLMDTTRVPFARMVAQTLSVIGGSPVETLRRSS